MNMNKIRVVEINTTAYEEENFSIITNLSDDEIINAINPIVQKERKVNDIEEFSYENEDLINALMMYYPYNFVQMVAQPVDKIII
jgi:hypothetical protein